MRLIVLLLCVVSLALAQTYSDFDHVAGGPFKRVGYHPAKNLAAYDSVNQRFVDIPGAYFSGNVYQIASVGAGFVAVGDFTAVNGIQAIGFAYYNGTQWLGYPHLSLMFYNRPNIQTLTNYTTNNAIGGGLANQNLYPTNTYVASQVRYGGAVAVYVSGNQLYIYGGRTSANPGSPRFNLIGEQLPVIPSAANGALGYDGLARFNIITSGSQVTNFSLDTTFSSYVCQGGQAGSTFGPPECNANFNGGGLYVGDTGPVLSAYGTNPGTLKFKVQGSGASPALFVYTGSTGIYYWVPGTMSSWYNPLMNSPATFNVSGKPATNNFANNGLNSPINCPNGYTISDADVDVSVSPPIIIVVGNFNNTVSPPANTVPNYFHVATLTVNLGTTTAFATNNLNSPNQINWSNTQYVPNFVAQTTGVNRNAFTSGLSKITVVTAQNYFFTAQYIDPTQTPGVNNNRFNNDALWRYFQVQGSSPTALTITQLGAAGSGARFESDASQLLQFNGQVVVIGPSDILYNLQYNAADLSTSRFIQQFPPAITYTNNDWASAFGGFVQGTLGSPFLITTNSSIWWIYYPGITSAYDVYSAGSLVAYDKNSNVQKWFNAAPFRFLSRAQAVNSLAGSAGVVYTTHWLSTQPPSGSGNVVVAGSFDWIGTQLLGSVAYLNLNQIASSASSAYSSVGGGLWTLCPQTAVFDQDNSPLVAGTVYDLEESNGVLYAGGLFSYNSNYLTLANIAALNIGDSNGVWFNLGCGCDGTVVDLLYNSGKLYVAGTFDSCGGVPGSRGIAYWSTGSQQWYSLGYGFPGVNTATNGGIATGDSRPFAMEMFMGTLYVGGNFATPPGGLRAATTPTGLFAWNSNGYWQNVIAKCESQCSVSPDTDANYQLTANSYDPLTRTIPGPVKSLRNFNGILYAVAGTSGNLYGYDGTYIYKFGSPTSSGCLKQGCLSRNFTSNTILGAGFTEGTNYNNLALQFSQGNGNNWVNNGYEGFDAAPYFIASASAFSISFFLLALVLAYLF